MVICQQVNLGNSLRERWCAMSEKAKGIFGIFLLVGFMFGGIQSCTHEHEWIEATCTEPRTCRSCNKTDGIPLGHQWQEATCQMPKVCSVCGETSGTAKWHNWTNATCIAPKTCTLCGATKGEALGHTLYQLDWFTSKHPTCQSTGTKSNTCRRCGKTETISIPVVSCVAGNWQTIEGDSNSSVLVKARYCIMCGVEMERKTVTLSSTSDKSGVGGSGGRNFNSYNNENQQNTTASYVLNTSTMKFHRPSCSDVPRISPSNYATSSQSRSELISRGYSACGHCNP